MVRTLRWFACFPLAFLASVLAGALTTWMTRHAFFLGPYLGGSWTVWAMSGFASAIAFVATVFRVAPSHSEGLKWATLIIVGTLGIVATAGPLLSGHEPSSASAGVAMVLCAAYFARHPAASFTPDAAPVT